MRQTFKRAMSLFMAMAMVLSMVPSFGTHVHAEELETEPVVVTEAPATEAPVVEAPVTEAPATEAPTQAPETEAPTEPATEAPEVVETEAPEVTTEATEAPEVETEPVEETIPDETEEIIPEEIFEEELIEEEAVAADITWKELSGLSVDGLEGTYSSQLSSSDVTASSSRGEVTWGANGKDITGVVTGYKSGAVSGTIATQLILKNTSGEEATLSFAWSLSGGGSVTTSDVDDNESDAMIGTSGEYSAKLASDASLTITVYSPKGKTNNTLSITNILLLSAVSGDVTTEFMPAESGGSYTVNEVTVTTDKYNVTAPTGTKYNLIATASDGYQFFGWYNETNETYVSYAANYVLTAVANWTLVPKFVDENVALFGVGSAKFDDLTEAGKYAAAGGTKTIVLLNDGAVSGSHTIPAGTTLLVPFDDDNTLYTTEPEHTNVDQSNTAAWVQPTAYRTLTLAENASITVNGAISVSGKHYAGGGNVVDGGVGAPTEAVGFINMGNSSNITLNAGAYLYAWGFIVGSGTVTAKSGSTVYENFQVRDFRGGGATAAMASGYGDDGDAIQLVFPLSQYYVQNIEVETTFESGAEEYVYTSLFMSGSSYSSPVKFIGDGAMFRPESGCKLTKEYVGAKDRLCLGVEGNASLAGISIELQGKGIESAMFTLPINSNIDINIKSGTTTLMQDIALLPGASLTIAQGATLNIASGIGSAASSDGTGYNLFVYDADEWEYGYNIVTFDPDNIDGSEKTTDVKYVHQYYQLIPLTYAPGMSYKRTVADLRDVAVDVNGTLITNGFVYTTSGGANITSSEKTGTIVFQNGAGEEMFTYQAGQNGTQPVYYVLPVTSAQLKNGDGTYLDTTGAKAGTTYNYCAKHDQWYTDTCVDCAKGAVEITWANLGFTTDYTEEFDVDSIPSYKNSTIPTKASSGCTSYTFAGWKDAGGKEYPTGTALPAATADATYYAYFTEEVKHTPEDDDGDCTTAVKCVNCSENAVEAMAAHVAGQDDGDCTTAVKCVNCSKNAVEAKTHVDGGDKNHDCDNCSATNVDDGCHGGTAYCNAKAICAECGQEYGEEKPDNHASTEVTYTNNGDTHSATYDCCKAPYVTNEPHTYVNGICACEAVQTFTVTVYNEYGQADEITLSNTTATYGQDYVTKISSNVGSYVEVWAVTTESKFNDDSWQGNYVFDFDEDTDTLTIFASYVTENLVVKVVPCVDLSINLNGGAVSEAWEFLNPVNGVITGYAAVGEEGFIAPKWDEVNETMNDATNEAFIREGYTVVSYNTAADGTGTTYALGTKLSFTEDTTLYLIWQANEYTVTWNIDGVPTTETKDYGTEIEAPAAPAPREGYKFDGWTYGTKTYKPGDVIGTVPVNGITINLTSSWQVNSYTLTWIIDGVKTTETVAYGTEIKAPDAPKAEEGYFFMNWSCGEETYDAGDVITTMPGADHEITLTANWEPKTYNLTYMVGEDQIGAGKQFGANLTFPEAGRTGYTLTWKDANGKEYTTEDTMPASDLTLYAHYTAIEYTLTVNVLATGDTVELTVPYGANLLETLAAAAAEKKIPAIGDRIRVNNEDFNGELVIFEYSYSDGVNEHGLLNWSSIGADFTMPAGDFEVDQDSDYYGWIFTDADLDGVLGAEYFDGDYLIGWNYIEEDFDGVEGGAWYYFETIEIDDVPYYYRAEGITRVPYPEETIEGITYDANAEDAANTKYDYTDENDACFVFDENGKFQYNLTGFCNGGKNYAVNGQLLWHVGLVTDGTAYYYFVGANKMATGDVYISRNTTDREVNKGGVYTFGEDGKLCEYNGIVDMTDGSKRYYENAQLMLGNGLTKVGDNYIYVRSNGELVVSGQYWIGTNGLYIATGMYDFDENGFMIDPIDANKNGVIDGVYYVDGKPYYAGLIEYNGGLIYVKSNGELATGKYWVTKTNNMEGYKAGFYYFDADGYMEQVRNGIVNGCYYVNNKLACNAGLIEYNDGLIYVRSNGMVATGKYWITNTNGLMPAGCYEFDENGYMIVGTQDGIVPEDGKLYYYIAGVKQIGIGLVAYGDSYIYVKTSGELATGAYWVTNVGDTSMEQGLYEFGADGIMIK